MHESQIPAALLFKIFWSPVASFSPVTCNESDCEALCLNAIAQLNPDKPRAQWKQAQILFCLDEVHCINEESI